MRWEVEVILANIKNAKIDLGVQSLSWLTFSYSGNHGLAFMILEYFPKSWFKALYSIETWGLQLTNSTLFWKPAESFCLRRQLSLTWWRQWFELFLRFAWLLCHVGNDELATTSTLFLLEVPPSIMEGRFDLPGTIESLLRNSESVPIVMATVGDAYHTILQQVSLLIAPKFLLFWKSSLQNKMIVVTCHKP